MNHSSRYHEPVTMCKRCKQGKARISMATLILLPSELILLISDLLPPTDLVCFALCNHGLYSLLRIKFPEIKADILYDQVHLGILTRLERDIPEYFVCDICKVLHNYNRHKNSGFDGMIYKQPCELECVRIGQSKTWFEVESSLATHSTATFSEKKITYLHLKLAMMQFYHGPKSGTGISTESFAYTQIRHYPMYCPFPEMISLFSIDAQICPDPLGLFVRMQDILLFEDFNYPSYYPIDWEKPYHRWSTDPLLPFHICLHTHLTDFIGPIQRSTCKKGVKRNIIKHCPLCHTDSLVEIGQYNSKLVVIITRWVNLGPGLSQNDPLWKARTFELDDSCDRSIAEDPSVFRERGPRSCYEKTADLSYDSLKALNLSYLEDQNYKNSGLFKEIPKKDLWFIPHQSGRFAAIWARARMGKVSVALLLSLIVLLLFK